MTRWCKSLWELLGMWKQKMLERQMVLTMHWICIFFFNPVLLLLSIKTCGNPVFIKKLCCSVSPRHWIKNLFQLGRTLLGHFFSGRGPPAPLWPWLRALCSPDLHHFYVLVNEMLLVALTRWPISVSGGPWEGAVHHPSPVICTRMLIWFRREIENWSAVCHKYCAVLFSSPISQWEPGS